MSVRSADVSEERSTPSPPCSLHHRRLDVDDVGARLLGVQRQFHTVLRRHGRRARLDHDFGVDARASSTATSSKRFRSSMVSDQNSRDAAGHPQHRVPEITDAVAHQCAVRVPVDVVAVGPAERRVERVADSPQGAGAPTSRASAAVAIACLIDLTSSGEVLTAVDVDVGAGHVGVAPRGQKRGDGPDFVGQARRAAGERDARNARRWRPSARRGRCRRHRPTTPSRPTIPTRCFPATPR